MRLSRRALFAAAPALALAGPAAAQTAAAQTAAEARTRHRTVQVEGLDVFYREAGPADAPAVLLLHGFPTSSHMFRDLIPRLAPRFRVVAPDFPGFGFSSQPDRAAFPYTFDNIARVVAGFTRAVNLARYALYVMDYGAPVGWRLALAHPERVIALVVQNGNAYEEGLREFWDPLRAYWAAPGDPSRREALRPFTKLDATVWQYTHGVPDISLVSPDAWRHDQAGLDRPGNDEIQLDLFYDYRTNLPLYPRIQAAFRRRRWPALIAWGKNDPIFPPVGAEPYRRDLPVEGFHLLDTGHFALETHGAEIARLMEGFLARHTRA
jgi:pimeloyl-ACP methyl ester carboxylesterase